jgi:HPt (histidine-containing phosphotransfer) domain-containing protein
MDGYEATSMLRDHGYVGPILALTANTMSGDAEHCLVVGCNEHLSKPIDRRRLIQRIAAHVGRVVEEDRGLPMLEKEPTMEDASMIVSEYIDDPDMGDMIHDFVGRLPEQLAAMRDALAEVRYEDLRRLAHTLKGSGGSYGYPALTETAAIIENAAKIQDRGNALATIEVLANIIQAVQRGCEAVISGVSR